MSAYTRKLRARVRRLKGERAFLREDLSNTADEAAAAVASLQANYDDLNARHTNLQEAHADAAREITRIPTLKRAVEDLSRLVAKVPVLDSNVRNLRHENAAQASKIEQLERELDQLKRDGHAPNGWVLLRATTGLTGEPVPHSNRYAPAGTMVGPVVAAAAAIVPWPSRPSYLPRDAALGIKSP